VDKDGQLLADKPAKALNKVGHALHKFDPVFHRITFSSKVKEVIEKVTEMKQPLVIQSMVIFKHPKVGGVGKDI
jgi:phytanoyl-CoA hydroxylase